MTGLFNIPPGAFFDDAGVLVHPSPEDWAEADRALADFRTKVTPEWFARHEMSSRKHFATAAMQARQERERRQSKETVGVPPHGEIRRKRAA